jgi:hypothetical protein
MHYQLLFMEKIRGPVSHQGGLAGASHDCAAQRNGLLPPRRCVRVPRNRSVSKTKSASLRSWRASLIRKRGQVLGSVEAATREAAEAAAAREFNLSPEQRSRLVVQERG